MQSHDISRSIVTGNGTKIFRCACSCGFKADAPRFSTALRRKQDRLVAEHLLQATRAELIAIEREAAAPLRVSTFPALRAIGDALDEIRTV